jgi:hypothetical protein
MTDTDQPAPDPALSLERVELAFPELLAGFRVEERQLSFDGVVVADLLARAGTRTLLISMVSCDDAEAALCALDSLSFARNQRELLADYLPGESFCGSGPEVVLVAESFSARLRARLSAFAGASDFWLVTRHELKTSRGSLTRLRRVEDFTVSEAAASVELPSWATEEPLRTFLAQIAPDRLGLALETVERVQRIDPALRWSASEDLGVICHLDGAPLCHLAWVAGHIELNLAGGGVPHAIRDAGGIDFVLDWVLTCFLELIEAARGEATDELAPLEEEALPAAASDTADDALAEQEPKHFDAVGATAEAGDELSSEDLPDGPELRQVELQPLAPAPLLSKEELEAFLE